MVELDNRHNDLLRRKNAIEKEFRRVVARLDDLQTATAKLQEVIVSVKAKLPALLEGPVFSGKSPSNDLKLTNVWQTDCVVRFCVFEGLKSTLKNPVRGLHEKARQLFIDWAHEELIGPKYARCLV